MKLKLECKATCGQPTSAAFSHAPDCPNADLLKSGTFPQVKPETEGERLRREAQDSFIAFVHGNQMFGDYRDVMNVIIAMGNLIDEKDRELILARDTQDGAYARGRSDERAEAHRYVIDLVKLRGSESGYLHVADCVKWLESKCAEHKCKLPDSINEALNSGKGVYKP